MLSVIFFFAFATAIETLLASKPHYIGFMRMVALITDITYSLTIAINNSPPIPSLMIIRRSIWCNRFISLFDAQSPYSHLYLGDCIFCQSISNARLDISTLVHWLGYL